MKLFATTAIVLMSALPLAAQQVDAPANADWVGTVPLDPANCVFTNITPGVVVWNDVDAFQTSGVGGFPASVDVNVTSVSELVLSSSGLITASDGNTLGVTFLSHVGSAVSGATDTTVSGSSVDTPDGGTDSFTLSIAGEVGADATPVKGVEYTLTNIVTCVLAGS